MLKRSDVCSINDLLIASCLPEFLALVPSEEAAIDLILQTQIEQRKLVCRCGHVFENATRAMYERRVKCAECKGHTHFTVGTLYERVSQVRARLGAVWLMDHGAVVTSTKLNQIFGIATSTGLCIINTIGLFIESLRRTAFDDVSESVSCPIFGEIMIKRSRITGAYEHAASLPEEVTVADAGPDLENGFSQAFSDTECSDISDDLGDLDRAVLAQISAAPISVDTICESLDSTAGPVGAALTMLELLGHIASGPGNSFVRLNAAKVKSDNRTEFSPEVLAFAEAAIENIKAIRQGVSRKYLQLYLGTFWCCFDRNIWRTGELMLVSVDATLAPDRNLFDYESPLMVSVAI